MYQSSGSTGLHSKGALSQGVPREVFQAFDQAAWESQGGTSPQMHQLSLCMYVVACLGGV